MTSSQDSADAAELDIERPGVLAAYLKSTGRVPASERLRISHLAGGVSSRTLLVERADGCEWVVKQSLPQLRVATEWLCDPSRIHREGVATLFLNRLLPPGTVSEMLFEDRPQHVLALKCVARPHQNWKEILLTGRCDTAHVRQFGRLLGQMHRCGYERRAELPNELADNSFFDALRLEPYYRFVAARLPAARDFMYGLADRTGRRRDTLVHGDFSPKNILVHQERLILLDHEVAHLGDASFDVGFSLAHLLSKAHYLVSARAAFGRAADLYWQTYRQELGNVPWQPELDRRSVEHTLACLLARVAGRSPLEYLDDERRARQQEAVLQLMAAPPPTVEQLIPSFLQRIQH